VRLTRITKSFGATRAVDDVSLEIVPGEILALAGENGAGKTTLMRVAAGELAPDSGSVEIDDPRVIDRRGDRVIRNRDKPVILSCEDGAIQSRGNRVILSRDNRVILSPEEGEGSSLARRGRSFALFAAQDDTRFGAQDDTRFAAQDETRAAAQDETRAAAQDDTRAAAQDDTRAAAQNETRAAVQDGSRSGVGFVHQHFLLVPELTIAENLAVGERGFRFATRRTLEQEAVRTIAATGIELREVGRRVAELSVGEKSKLELIKAIAKNPSTLILDEPTSVLTPYEAEELFRVMRTLAARGTAIVFISHKLPEVLAVAHRVVVMRAGRIVLETREATATELAAAMTQAPIATPAETSAIRGPLAYASGDLQLHQNEILAIVGVAGNGQAELARTLLSQLPDAAHIPEDRTRDGIVAEMTIAENLALRGVPPSAVKLYSIRAQSARQRAGDLSGGNQQKVVLARELDRRPRIIVAAEPTRGLDLEATAFVHDKLRAAAASGAAILLITSDLDEAFALAGSLQVIYRRRLSERMTPEEASMRVASLMAGVA